MCLFDTGDSDYSLYIGFDKISVLASNKVQLALVTADPEVLGDSSSQGVATVLHTWSSNSINICVKCFCLRRSKVCHEILNLQISLLKCVNETGGAWLNVVLYRTSIKVTEINDKIFSWGNCAAEGLFQFVLFYLCIVIKHSD